MTYDPALVIAQNPLAFWRLNNANDSSGNNRTLNNIGLNFGGASLVGGSNASAALPGNTGQRGHIDDVSSGGWPESIRRIDAWIKQSTVAAGSRVAVTRGWSNGANDFAMILIPDGNHIYAQCQLSTGTVITADSPLAYTTADTCYCTVSFTGTTLDLYINGALARSKPAVGTLKTASWAAVTLGAFSSGQAATEFAGLLDEVAVFAVPATLPAHQQLYVNGGGTLPITAGGRASSNRNLRRKIFT